MCTQGLEGLKGLCVCAYIPSSLAGQVVIWSCSVSTVMGTHSLLNPLIPLRPALCHSPSAACTLVLLPGSTSQKRDSSMRLPFGVQALPCDSHLLMSSESECLYPFLGSHKCCRLPCYRPYLPSFTVLQNMGSSTAQIPQQGVVQCMDMKENHPLFWKSSSFNAAKSHRTFSINHVTINHTALLSTKGLLSWKSLYKHLYTQLYLLWGLMYIYSIKFPIRIPSYSRFPYALRT